MPRSPAVIAPDRHPPMAPWLEQAWLMRYLDRQLGADEQAWFEGYLLDKPELLDQVEADTALRDAVAAQQAAGLAAPAASGLRAVAGSGAASVGSAGDGDSDAASGRTSDPTASATATRAASRGRHRRGARGGWLALAASFVGGIGLTALGLSLLDDGSAGLVANPPRIIFDTLRGELTEPRVEPGDPASPIVLVEFPVPPGQRILGVWGVLGDAEMAMQIPAISADGYSTFAVPSSWRSNAKLRVSLKGLSGEPTEAIISIP
jgi:hypothetical protein